MDNVLFKYFEHRYKDIMEKSDKPEQLGPVITISRQAGCEAKKLTQTLVEKLNKHSRGKQWRIVDKEILEKSAKELNLSKSKIEHFYQGADQSRFIDLFIAFSKTYVNEIQIKNTIIDVIKSFCKQGHIILLGRAGAAILQNQPNVLNIRLTAPFAWRINTVMNNRQCSIEDAEEWAIDTDEKRYKLYHQFIEKHPSNIDYLFDATLNRKYFNIEQTADIILELAKIKKIKM